MSARQMKTKAAIGQANARNVMLASFEQPTFPKGGPQ